MIVAEPSSCGKTTFISNLIKNNQNLIHPEIEKIIWCTPEPEAFPKNIQFNNIEFYNNIPENFSNLRNEKILIVLDDMMIETYNKQVCELFTKGSHHRNLSVILLIQNIFHQGKFLNAKYLVDKYLQKKLVTL